MNLFTRFLLGPIGMLVDDVKYLMGKKDDTVYGSVGRVLKGQSDGSSVLDNVFSSALGKYTGSNLTGAEREANEFNSAEAQKQRNWEERMANTQYQRGVADMSAAGVNPALMFGSGQPAPTPSGASASGVSPSFSGLADLMSLIMLPAQIKNIEANTNKTNREANEELPARIANLQEQNNLLRSQVVGTDLDNDSKSIVLRYLDDQQAFYTASLGLTNDKIQQEINESVARVNNLSEQNKQIIQSICESKQRVAVLQAEEKLTLEQAREVAHLIKQIDQNTALLKNQTDLTQKDINWYTANHIITPATSLVGDVIGAVGKGIGKGLKAAKGSSAKSFHDPFGYMNE